MAFVGEREETCEWMEEKSVSGGEEATDLSQEVFAYGVHGLNDERMEVFVDVKHVETAD